MSDQAPKNVRVSFIGDNIWFEFAEDPLPTHGRLKASLHATLAATTEAAGLGQYFAGGVYVSHSPHRYCGVPLGSFVAYESLRSGRVSRVAAKVPGMVELVGGPDMTLELAADETVMKDLVDLFQTYWDVGVREYWLIDGRKKEPRLDIYRRGPDGFVPTRRSSTGWLKSAVFGQSFRLTRTDDPVGDPRHTLETRP